MSGHTSYSRVNQYLRCGMAYQFKYLEDIPPEFLPEPLVFGSAFHRCAEAFFTAIKNGTEIPALDQLHELFHDAWNEMVEPDDAPPLRFKDGQNADTQSQLARRMLEAFLQHFSNHKPDIVAVEERLTADLGGSNLPPLVAFLDVIERLPSGEIQITEVKTAARKYPEASAFDSLQLAAYAAIAKAQGHEGLVQVKYLVVTKTKEPAVQELVAVLDDQDIAKFTSIARAVHQGVDAAVFVPNPSWACGGCQYARTCAERLAKVA